MFSRATVQPSSYPKTSYAIPDIEINASSMFSALLELDTKKSIGHDGIPNMFLRRYAEWCAKYLNIIFKETIRTAEIPLEWKTGKVVPIYKTGDKP